MCAPHLTAAGLIVCALAVVGGCFTVWFLWNLAVAIKETLDADRPD